MSFCEFFCHVVVGRSVNTTQSFSFVVLVLAGVFVKGHPSGRFSYAQIFRALASLGLARCLVVDLSWTFPKCEHIFKIMQLGGHA